ncbi:unnamed protein product [Brachionus calyciflorus]|uniref:FLYWCH-type domain-containing protein n=1 Tax=Brachionus calyciflorus TaxID=104777 RepID=A0A814B425_9BILA|nr:unnamed protein product [Brachionus calyciflorus]
MNKNFLKQNNNFSSPNTLSLRSRKVKKINVLEITSNIQTFETVYEPGPSHILNKTCEISESENDLNDSNLTNFLNIDFDEELLIDEDNSSNFDNLISKMNKLALEPQLINDTWCLTKTNKNGYKLCSLGMYFVIDKPKLDLIPTAKKIYWKCERPKCPGRANSNGLIPPLKFTKNHNHESIPERKDKLLVIEKTKDKASASNDFPRTILRDTQLSLNEETISLLSKPEALRKMIVRERNKNTLGSLVGFNAKTLSEIFITETQKKTYNNELFYWDDSGSHDKNRVLIFTTKTNLEFLNNYNDWYCDGTFDIAPTFFKQCYTIHIYNRKQSVSYGLCSPTK